jgi:hypothetical protein
MIYGGRHLSGVPGKTFTYGPQGVEEGLVFFLCFISPLPGNTTLVSCDAIENAIQLSIKPISCKF